MKVDVDILGVSLASGGIGKERPQRENEEGKE